MTTILTNNTDLTNFVANMSIVDRFAIRTKGEIKIYENEKQYKKDVKKTPDAVHGSFDYNNYVYYKL